MLERIRRREARVRWRRKRDTRDSSPDRVDIELQPLGNRGERPILRGVGPSIKDEMRAMRDVQRGMEDRMLTMFEKTLVLLRNQQEDMHFLGVELQAVKKLLSDPGRYLSGGIGFSSQLGSLSSGGREI